METQECRKCGESKLISEFYLLYGKPRNVCKVCTKAQNNARYQENKEAVCKRTNSYYRDNKERYTELRAASRKRNPEKSREATRRYRDKDREAYRRKDAARANKRRADKLQRTPKWADLEKIREIYENCPKGFHVDHVIPLQGKNVSGLHVENNLKAIPASENLSKSNKFPQA